jgi:succinoglycan biosynthesis transport protein ExoP
VDESQNRHVAIKVKKPFNPVGAIVKSFRLILLITVVGSFLTIPVVALKTRPKYEAEAVIIVNPYFPKVLFKDDEGGSINSYEDWMRTQVMVIKSFPVMEQAILEYHQQGFIWKGHGESMKSATDRLVSRIKITQIKDTQLILVSMKSSNRRGLADIVNCVVRSYIRSANDQGRGESGFKVETLKKDKEKINQELNDAFAELDLVSRKFGTAITEEKNLYVYIDSLIDVKKASTKAIIERISAESKIKALRNSRDELRKLDVSGLVDDRSETNSLLSDNLLALNRKETETIEQLVGITPENPKYASLTKRLQQLNEQSRRIREQSMKSIEKTVRGKLITENLIESEKLRAEYLAALDIERQMAREVARVQSEVLNYNAAILKATTRKREIQRLQDTLNRINERIDQIMIESTNPGRIFVQSFALPPESPSDDPRKKMMGLCVAGSFMVGLFLVVGRAMLDNTIKRPDHVAKVLGFPITGYLIDSVREQIPSDTIATLFRDYPNSFLAGQFRQIALKFQKDHVVNGSRTFAFFSVTDRNGSSTLAANTLAMLDAPDTKKLLMDLNHRHPLVKQFPDIFSPGGSTVSHNLFPFTILPHDGRGETASHLDINDARLLLDELKQSFEYIFLDAPPYLLCPNSTGIASIVDVVVLVAETNKTLWGELVGAVNQLDRDGIKVIAVVLNKVEVSKKGYLTDMIDAFNEGAGEVESGTAPRGLTEQVAMQFGRLFRKAKAEVGK